MKYYLAPLEGITTYVYRNAYHKYFGGIDRYYTPFIVPHKEKKFNSRELKELSTEHNAGLHVIPQLLTNNAEDFLKTANDIVAMGYEEINLNLGCPSKTVVTKKKGAGFLEYPEELDAFLEEIFLKTKTKISIKTRIGKDDPEEFYRLLKIYNKYPVEELIIHPRVQTDYYKNIPNWDVFEVAYKESKNSICYNGDINTKMDYEALMERFPNLQAVMLGRGIIYNPGLISGLKGDSVLTKETLYAFHDQILNDYIEISSGDRNVLFKMKELWFYMITLFEDADKFGKKIKKTEKLRDYQQVIDSLFDNCSFHGDKND